VTDRHRHWQLALAVAGVDGTRADMQTDDPSGQRRPLMSTAELTV